MSEVIRAVNNLFEGDARAYVDTVLKAKMLESGTLKARAAATSRQQFNSSPGLGRELMNAIMDATTAHGEISRQALASESVRGCILSTLIGPDELWQALRHAGQGATSEVPSATQRCSTASRMPRLATLPACADVETLGWHVHLRLARIYVGAT